MANGGMSLWLRNSWSSELVAEKVHGSMRVKWSNEFTVDLTHGKGVYGRIDQWSKMFMVERVNSGMSLICHGLRSYSSTLSSCSNEWLNESMIE